MRAVAQGFMLGDKSLDGADGSLTDGWHLVGEGLEESSVETRVNESGLQEP
jgi:hypothetical protein